jgi:hypothetical protein
VRLPPPLFLQPISAFNRLLTELGKALEDNVQKYKELYEVTKNGLQNQTELVAGVQARRECGFRVYVLRV